MYVNYKIELNKRIGDSDWDLDETTNVDEFSQPVVTQKIDAERNDFSMVVPNFLDEPLTTFNPRDMITLKRVINSTSFSEEDVLIRGLISDTKLDKSSGTNTLRVEGFDFSDMLLNAITFVDATNLTITDMMKQALNNIQVYNENFAVTWSDSNPELTSTGDAFPIVGESLFNKSLRGIFLDYSSDSTTGDGNYYWYINKDKELIWRRRTLSVNQEFNYTEDDYAEIKDGKDVDDVRNWIIVKGGRDPANKQIQTLVQDLPSIARHGIRHHIIPSVSKNAEYYNKLDMDSIGNTTGKFPDSYEFTTTWVSKSTGAVVEVANDEEYVNALRNHVTEILREKGRAYLDQRKYGKYQLEIGFLPGREWGLGDVVRVINYPFPDGATEKRLRVVEINYGVDIDSFVLEEDEGTI